MFTTYEDNSSLQLYHLMESEIELAKVPSLASFGNCGNLIYRPEPLTHSRVQTLLHIEGNLAFEYTYIPKYI